MYWQNVGEFFAMGGYAAYVWGAYGVTLLCLIIELISLRSRRKRALDSIRTEE